MNNKFHQKADGLFIGSLFIIYYHFYSVQRNWFDFKKNAEVILKYFLSKI